MSDRPLSERYETDVLHMLADRHQTRAREVLLPYGKDIAKLEAERDRLREIIYWHHYRDHEHKQSRCACRICVAYREHPNTR